MLSTTARYRPIIVGSQLANMTVKNWLHGSDISTHANCGLYTSFYTAFLSLHNTSAISGWSVKIRLLFPGCETTTVVKEDLGPS